MVYACLSFQEENGPGALEPWLVKEMDSCLSSVFLDEDQDAFLQLFNLILYESVNGASPEHASRHDAAGACGAGPEHACLWLV